MPRDFVVRWINLPPEIGSTGSDRVSVINSLGSQDSNELSCRYIEEIMAELSFLELYILSCLEEGMHSPYDLLRNALLSLGASTPALDRLKRAGMVSRKKTKGATSRPRYEYTITPHGRQALQGSIVSLLTATGDQDMDSVLRIVDIAKRHGATNKEIAGFLKRVSEHRDRLAKHAAVESEYEGWDYPALKRVIDSGRLKAEAKALADLARRAASTRSRNIKGSRS